MLPCAWPLVPSSMLSWWCRNATELGCVTGERRSPAPRWPALMHGPGQLLRWVSAAVVGKKHPREKVGRCGDVEHLRQGMLAMPGGDGEPTAMHAVTRGFLLGHCVGRQSGTPEVGVHHGLGPDSWPSVVQGSRLRGCMPGTAHMVCTAQAPQWAGRRQWGSCFGCLADISGRGKPAE